MKLTSTLRNISLIAGTVLISCSGEQQEKTGTVISGQLDSYKGGEVIFQKLGTQNVESLDTINVSEDGEFKYYASIDGIGFYRLQLGNQNFFNFILSKEDNLEITADANNLEGTYSIKGSEESTRLKQLNQRLGGVYQGLDSLRKVMQQMQMQRNIQGYQQAAQAQYAIAEKKNNIVKDFIDEKPGSMASLAAVQNLDPNKDYPYFKKVAEGLKDVAPNSPYYKNLQQQVEKMKKLAVGAEAPEIALENPQGEVVKLSSLEGKVVLVDFWASWCKPCRRENPNVVKMYNKYKDRGFEIYGVSLDKNRGAWLKAIEQDNLTWTHVSDLQFWNSAAAKTYNVSSIPKTYLLDEEGNIIAKDLRGPSLEEKLEEIFSNT